MLSNTLGFAPLIFILVSLRQNKRTFICAIFTWDGFSASYV